MAVVQVQKDKQTIPNHLKTPRVLGFAQTAGSRFEVAAGTNLLFMQFRNATLIHMLPLCVA